MEDKPKAAGAVAVGRVFAVAVSSPTVNGGAEPRAAASNPERAPIFVLHFGPQLTKH